MADSITTACPPRSTQCPPSADPLLAQHRCNAGRLRALGQSAAALMRAA